MYIILQSVKYFQNFSISNVLVSFSLTILNIYNYI